MISLTFLQAKMALAKKILANGQTEPYPNAAQFLSHHQTVTNIDEFATAMRYHASEGHCLHVGNLTQPITQWGRRAGLADRATPLQWVVLDLDGITHQYPFERITETTFRRTLREALALLGVPALADTDCVIQASTKMGLHQNLIAAHVFYLLDAPVPAAQIKLWLKELNLNTPLFSASLRLSATGHSLCWPLDITAADPGRLIYIAPPRCAPGALSPFADDRDRILVLEGTQRMLPAEMIKSAKPHPIQETRLKNSLRETAGLPNERARTRMLNIGNDRFEVLLNPALGTLRPAMTARGFCYYNLNEGDSCAYYHPEGRPEFIYNFKGEPLFRWEDVDPTGYAAYCEAHAEAIAQAEPILPFMVRNQSDDQVYKVWYDRINDSVTVVKSRRDCVSDFYAEYGKIEPEYLATWTVEHQPQADHVVDLTGRSINLFKASELMRYPPEMGVPPASHKDIQPLNEQCPSIMFLINHIAGNGQEEVRHFMNWLAVSFQTRDKTGSAFIFQGTTGTGKGTLYECVLQPLFGQPNVTMKNTSDLQDMFTGWRKGKLIVCFDEFEVPNTTHGRAMVEKLRTWITEATPSVREMHKEGASTRTYDSFLFFTNQYNIVPIADGERRFTICPRQEVKLAALCNTADLRASIERELPAFAGMLASFQINKDAARFCIENDAKEYVRQSSATSAEEFVSALRGGDLDFVLSVFEASAGGDPMAFMNLEAAKQVVMEMIRGRHQFHRFTVSQLTTLYNTLLDQDLSGVAFGKMLSRYGIPTTKFYDGSKRVRGYQLKMDKTSWSEEELNAFLAAQKTHLKLVEAAE